MKEITQNELDIKSEFFFEMLEKIKHRPGMYLGKCSINRLRYFLDGYMASRQDIGLPLTEQERKFDDFQSLDTRKI